MLLSTPVASTRILRPFSKPFSSAQLTSTRLTACQVEASIREMFSCKVDLLGVNPQGSRQKVRKLCESVR